MAVPGHRSSKAATFLSKTDAEQPAGLPIAMQAGGSLEVLALAVKTAPPVSHPAPLHAHLALLRPSLDRHTGKSCAGRRWLGMLRLELAICKPASPGLCPHAPSSQPLSTVPAPASRSCFPIHPFPDLSSKYCGPGGSTLQRAGF